MFFNERIRYSKVDEMPNVIRYHIGYNHFPFRKAKRKEFKLHLTDLLQRIDNNEDKWEVLWEGEVTQY